MAFHLTEPIVCLPVITPKPLKCNSTAFDIPFIINYHNEFIPKPITAYHVLQVPLQVKNAWLHHRISEGLL